MPLRNLAQAFARFVTGTGLSAERAAAAKRLRVSVAANPIMVAGEGRLDTRLAQRFGSALFTKTGAEGVFCAAFPDLGFGLALKCDDGASRGSEAMLLAIVVRLMGWSDLDRLAFQDTLDPVLRNWNGIAVGSVQTTAAFSSVPLR